MAMKRLIVTTFALALVALAFLPGLAAAQNATLYEVTENMKLRGNSHGAGRRVATAALMGTAEPDTTLCPSAIALLGGGKCAVTAIAKDNIDLSTGTGPVKGEFKVVIQGDNLVDAPELVVLRGEIEGQIDLSLAIFGPDGVPGTVDELPLGTIVGQWSATGEKLPADLQTELGVQRLPGTQGTFEGTFRLPFVLLTPIGCDSDGDPSDCTGTTPALYLLDSGDTQPVDQVLEHSLGVPTVKLEVTFTEQ